MASVHARAYGFHARTQRHTPLLTQKHKKNQLQFAQRSFGILFCGVMRQLFGSMDQRCVWNWEPAVCGRQDGFIAVSGNPRRKHHAVCEEAESWVSLDLPTQQ